MSYGSHQASCLCSGCGYKRIVAPSINITQSSVMTRDDKQARTEYQLTPERRTQKEISYTDSVIKRLRKRNNANDKRKLAKSRRRASPVYFAIVQTSDQWNRKSSYRVV